MWDCQFVKKATEAGDGNGEVKDLIVMLPDIREVENAEMRLTRANIRGLMLVNRLFLLHSYMIYLHLRDIGH